MAIINNKMEEGEKTKWCQKFKAIHTSFDILNLDLLKKNVPIFLLLNSKKSGNKYARFCFLALSTIQKKKKKNSFIGKKWPWISS